MYIKKIKRILCGLVTFMVVMAGTLAVSFPAFADTNTAPELGAKYWTYNYANGWSVETKDNQYVQAPVNSYVTAIWVELENKPEGVSGDISYEVNLSGSGWIGWQKAATEAGNIAGDMPLEAVKIKLTDQLAEQYDVYYSVFQSGAWTELVTNGETAGVEAQGKRVDGLRVAIRKKGAGAPEDPWFAARGIDPSKPMVALTYDDGPAPATWRILDVLETYGARATFYMVGNRMSSYPDTVRRIASLGSEIGSHTWGHNYITGLGAEALHGNLNQFDTSLSLLVGIRSATMRPPGGFVSEGSQQALASYGVPAIMWSIDTLDWKRPGASAVADQLKNATPGDIILMHDGGGDRSQTVEALRIALPYLKEQGFSFITIDEMMQYPVKEQ